MNYDLRLLENEHWQVGILPQTGASTAFGRIRVGEAWVDVMRPASEADYGNSSLCASFLLVPYSNRIRDAKFRFRGVEYILEVNNNEGSASHGDVRRRPWQVENADPTQIGLRFDSTLFDDLNFPFRFSAAVEYRLDGRDFVIWLSLTNKDDRPMPAGFGHHPYFVKTIAGAGAHIEIPADSQFELTNFLATAPAVPVTPRLDFRQLRPLGDAEVNDVLTSLHPGEPVRLVYPGPDIEVTMYFDAIFQHIILYAPSGKPYYAVEPVTNTNDGFNLYEQNIPGSGVFVLGPGESQSGTVRLRLDRAGV